jgi:hypothetical protein
VLGGGYTGLMTAVRLARRTRRHGGQVTQLATGQRLADLRIPELLAPAEQRREHDLRQQRQGAAARRLRPINASRRAGRRARAGAASAAGTAGRQSR